MRRAGMLLVLLLGGTLLVPGAAPAQEQLVISVVSRNTDYLWTGDPATIIGRATLVDGQGAAARILTVESRPYPFTGPFTPEGQILAGDDGRFTYERRPTKNVQVRIRGDAGQASPIFTFRVFAFAEEGRLKGLKDGRQRATETSLVPTGFEIAKAYLYFCKPKAKRCTYIKTGKARVRGQRMSVSADFKPPRKYAATKYTVLFRYVPKAGWGDSNSAERKAPHKTLSAEDQTGV